VTGATQNTQGFRGEGPGAFEDSVIKIDRFAKVVKGGRRFSFGALVVVGDRGTHVGLGYGKANEVPQAVEKAVANARKNLVTICLKANTIPHQVRGKWGASEVILLPASEGTGVIAGKAIRPLFQLAGIKDVLTKAYGSTSPVNLLKAGVEALKQLRTAETIRELRGVKVE
jgi:small subunit ribosomal protein S5